MKLPYFTTFDMLPVDHRQVVRLTYCISFYTAKKSENYDIMKKVH